MNLKTTACVLIAVNRLGFDLYFARAHALGLRLLLLAILGGFSEKLATCQEEINVQSS